MISEINVNSSSLAKNGWVIVGKKDSGKLQCTRCRKVQIYPVESYKDEATINPCKCRIGGSVGLFLMG